MSRHTARLVLMILAALTAAGCSRPSWTDPERSKGSHDWPRPPIRPGLPTRPTAGPALADWAVPLLNKPVRQVFRRVGTCVGNTDNVGIRFLGGRGASRVVGWAWDPATKAPVARVVLADAADRIVGGGETGYDRPDVPAAKPAVTSSKTGWEAMTARTSGRVGAYGVIQDGGAVCSLGGVEL
jgi:hypothetical protein